MWNDDRPSKKYKRWRKTVGKKEIQKPSEVSGKGGDFFPITAVQNWNKDNTDCKNKIRLLDKLPKLK